MDTGLRIVKRSAAEYSYVQKMMRLAKGGLLAQQHIHQARLLALPGTCLPPLVSHSIGLCRVQSRADQFDINVLRKLASKMMVLSTAIDEGLARLIDGSPPNSLPLMRSTGLAQS